MGVLVQLIGWMRKQSARRVRAWMVALLTVGFGLGPHAAFAQSDQCSGTAETITIQMPPSITVPRDTPDGTLLTPWIRTGKREDYYSCTSTVGTSGMVVQPSTFLQKAGQTVTGPGGDSYTVWKTGRPGIGIAMGVDLYLNGCGWITSWDLGSVPLTFSPWVGTTCTSSVPPPYRNGAQAYVALVKIGPVTAGRVDGVMLFEGGLLLNHCPPRACYSVPIGNRKQFQMTTVNIILGSCETPDVTVDMHSYKQSEFRGIGSTTPPVRFNVALKNCPTGLQSIQYEFHPNSAFDSGTGVITLSSDSTAQGIGLQLKDKNGNVLIYDHKYTLADYSSATGGSYQIQLNAAYYQTLSTVKPGSAKAAVTFTMNYR